MFKLKTVISKTKHIITIPRPNSSPHTSQTYFMFIEKAEIETPLIRHSPRGSRQLTTRSSFEVVKVQKMTRLSRNDNFEEAGSIEHVCKQFEEFPRVFNDTGQTSIYSWQNAGMESRTQQTASDSIRSWRREWWAFSVLVCLLGNSPINKDKTVLSIWAFQWTKCRDEQNPVFKLLNNQSF